MDNVIPGSPALEAVTVPRGMYRPELDGLRAIAVLAVIAGHLSGWDAPAHAGVTAFFVLSGFLITGLVRPGDLRGFYVRRVARLAPALIVVLAFVAFAFGAAAAPGIIGAATYSSNWLMAEHVDLGPLAPTWSLAVEEQFYLLWPIALILWPRQAVRISVAVIVLGAVLWIVLPWRVAYLATPTNAAAIMVGALIALRGIRVPRLLGALGLTVLVGGALSDAVALSVMGAALLISSGWLALSPLAPVGRRAYGLYLWHWPLILLLGPIGVPVTFLAAAVSYRWIETPARTGARRWLAREATVSTVTQPAP